MARDSSNSAGKTSSAWPARSRSRCRSPAATTRRRPSPCEDLPRQKVVLDTEQLTFKVRAQDDFGVKQVGMDWQGSRLREIGRKARPRAKRSSPPAATTKTRSDLAGTFSAKSLGIEPQPIELRLFAEDYLPGRARVYSPTYTLYVLNAEQHAIWLTEQLSKWHRQSLEVRDREMQLFETNKQLRELSRRRARPARDPHAHREPGDRPSGATAAGSRTWSVTGEDLIQQADAQSRIRRRPSREMGRDAADPQGHLGQPHAVGRRPLASRPPSRPAGRCAIPVTNKTDDRRQSPRLGQQGTPASKKPDDKQSPPPASRRSSTGIVAAAAR